MTTEVTTEVTPEVIPVLRLLAVATSAMTRAALQSALHLNDNEHFRKVYLIPALEAGLIAMTIPDKPTSRSPPFLVTSAGQTTLANARIRRST